MTTRPARKRRVTRLTVLRNVGLTPHMTRLVLGGPGFSDFVTNEFTDRYVKLLFRVPGVDYPEPFDPDAIRETMPREHWPVTRTYTVRHVDTDAGELSIDFVLHGDDDGDPGIAAAWAAGAEPGDEVAFFGPGGAYSPGPEADWHLMAGDEAALPAIAAALEAVAPGVPVQAFIEVADAFEEQPLHCPGELTVSWLHRDGAPAGDVTGLVDAVKAAPWLDGVPQVFVHGESGLVKGLRSYLRDERGVPPERISLSGYWRSGLIEQDFQAWKAEQKRAESVAVST